MQDWCRRHSHVEACYVTTTYDDASRLTAFDITSLKESNGEADYQYDDTNQLTDTTYDQDWQDDEEYVYDANGNRDEVTYGSDPMLDYGIGTNNQMTFDGEYTYEYDADGNRAKRYVAGTPNTDVTVYTWDHRNRMTKVTHYPTEGGAADKVFEYIYDHGNRWVRKTRNTDGTGDIEESSVFVYDGNQITLQFDKTGYTDAAAADLSHRYLYSTSIDQILADEQVSSLGTAGTIFWPLADHLGSVRDLLDSNSVVREHRYYNVFGKTTGETEYDSNGDLLGGTGNIKHLLGFTGRPFDVDSFLNWHLNRWYDTFVAKWASEDPIGFVAGDLNLYRYVGNSPIGFVDPLGLWKTYRGYDESKAIAVAEEGDTAQTLAKKIGLDGSEYDKWLSVPDRDEAGWVERYYWMPEAHLATALPKKASAAVREGCVYQIPNTMYMFWAGDWGSRGKYLVGWKKEQAYLRRLGFKIEVVELDTPAGAAVIGSSNALYTQLGKLSKQKTLHGLYYWAHGGPGGFNAGSTKKLGGHYKGSYATSTFSFLFVTIKQNLEYDLGLVVANSCNSAFPPGAKQFVAKPDGLLFGHYDWTNPAPSWTPDFLVDWYTGSQKTTPYRKLWPGQLFPPGSHGSGPGWNR